MTPSPSLPAPIVALIVVAGGLLVISTSCAIRPRAGAYRLGWGVIAGLAYAMLALVAALHRPETDGLRAGMLQLVAVILAAALGSVCSPSPASRREEPTSNPLGAAGRGLAWLCLVGLAPTVGFHGKLLVYRSLLAAGWMGLTGLAMAASAAALVPAVWAIRSPHPAPLRGVRVLLVVVLMAAILVLGCYPQPGMEIASFLESLAEAR